jgi:dsDNA-binding SOS-regulon protein
MGYAAKQIADAYDRVVAEVMVSLFNDRPVEEFEHREALSAFIAEYFSKDAFVRSMLKAKGSDSASNALRKNDSSFPLCANPAANTIPLTMRVKLPIIVMASAGSCASIVTAASPLSIAPADVSPPNGEARLFLPGLVCLRESNEHTCNFSPDGRLMYFTRDPDRITYVSTRTEAGWSEPVPAAFSGREAILSPDASELFFGDGDIWCIDMADGEGALPRKLPDTVNTGVYEFYASSTSDGTLYFSRLENQRTKILCSSRIDGHYEEARELPSPINQEASNNFHPFISPGGDFLLFNSDRAGGFGQADLYISYRDSNGDWSEPENLGEKINSGMRDICPTLSPDGNYLFFTRNWQEDGKWYGDLHWIDTFFLRKGVR